MTKDEFIDRYAPTAPGAAQFGWDLAELLIETRKAALEKAAKACRRVRTRYRRARSLPCDLSEIAGDCEAAIRSLAKEEET